MSGLHNSTVGRCVERLPDTDHLMRGTCRRPIGGDKTVQPQNYTLTVTNPNPEEVFVDFFETETGAVVVDGDLDKLQLN